MKIETFKKIQPPTPEDHDKKLREVADLYEKQFLREMMKSMRSTVSESGFIKTNQAEKIFREQLDHEYVEKWGDNGGIGLSDMIYNQLLDRLGPALGIKARPERPHGPIKLDEKSQLQSPFQARVSNELSSKNKTAINFTKLNNELNEAALEISSPWAGTLLGSKRLDTEESLVEIAHENGLKSQMVFKGQILPGLENQQIQAGQTIGVLSPQARSLHWNVEASPATVE